MTDQRLTHRQNQVLSFLAKHIDQSGFPPTRQEICDHFGFRSPNAAESHLRTLERKGMITIEGGRSRGIHLTAAARALLPTPRGAAGRLPLVGQVAAGSPILAEENIEDYCRLDPTLFRPRPHYFLRVRGDSMKDLGILDHDLLAVHRTPVAENGQVVVARLGEEVTVKRFQRRGRRVRLLPANPDYAPIEVDLAAQPLVIEGLGVGVLRDRMPD